jgi:hypothetical protein
MVASTLLDGPNSGALLMRMHVAVVCTLVPVAWSASLNIAANENLFENQVAAARSNNIVFSQSSGVANEDDPHLAPTLVVDSLSENRFDFHIEVENSIGPQVSILKYVCRTPQFGDGVIFPQEKRPIVPAAASIEIPGKMSMGIIQPSTSLDILLVYKTASRTFGSVHKFLVDHPVKPTERFLPASWPRKGNPFDIEKELQKEAVSALSKSEGTIFFVLGESRSDGSPNIFKIRAPDRSISFNSTTETAQFGSQSSILQSIFEQATSGLHTLIASWDESKQTMALTFDGREVSK